MLGTKIGKPPVIVQDRKIFVCHCVQVGFAKSLPSCCIRANNGVVGRATNGPKDVIGIRLLLKNLPNPKNLGGVMVKTNNHSRPYNHAIRLYFMDLL